MPLPAEGSPTLALVVEHVLDTLSQGGQNGAIKQQVQTSQQQSADYDSNQDFHRRINEAFAAAIAER
ncbi:hypothetical protein D3C73_1655500 [compost metagenome]